MACRARLLDVHGERLAGALEGLVERDLDARLHVAAASALPALEIFEADAFAPGPTATGRSPKMERKQSESPALGVAAVLDSEPATAAGRRTGLAYSAASRVRASRSGGAFQDRRAPRTLR